MYANENKIDQLLDFARLTTDRLMDVTAKLARIGQKVDAISERIRVADFRQWSAAHAALGLSTPQWSEDFSRQFNFDHIEEQLDGQPVPGKPKPRSATPAGDNPAQIAHTFTSRVAHPFAITCGRGWNQLISISLQRMISLATNEQFPLGISQVTEMCRWR